MLTASDLCRCATPFGVDVVGITEAIALIGALVGGLVARQRKKEAERLNEQLRKINMQLRQQARAGTVYAPGLSYAPVGRQAFSVSGTATIPLNNTNTEQTTETSMPTLKALSSTDEELSPEQENCRKVMREGKRLLRSNQGTCDRMTIATCLYNTHLTSSYNSQPLRFALTRSMLLFRVHLRVAAIFAQNVCTSSALTYA